MASGSPSEWLWPCCDRAVAVLWPCCDRALQYPVASGPPSGLLSTHTIAGAQVQSICMSGSGKSVVALQSDKLVNVVRLPNDSSSADPKDMRPFVGHTNPLVGSCPRA